MKLAEARQYVTKSALTSNTSTYGLDRVDYAIQLGLGMFIEETKCSVVTTNVTTPSSGNAIDVTATSGLGDFVPAHMIRATISNEQVWHKGIDYLHRQIDGDSGTGQPHCIGWDGGASNGYVYPAFDQSYTLAITHAKALIDWLPGIAQPDSSGAVVTLNVPDRFIRPALVFICSSYLIHGSNAKVFQTESWRRGEEWIRTVRGLCDMDAGAIIEIDTSDDAIQ